MFEQPKDESVSFDSEGGRVKIEDHQDDILVEKGQSFDSQGVAVGAEEFSIPVADSGDVLNPVTFETISSTDSVHDIAVEETQEYPQAPYKLVKREDTPELGVSAEALRKEDADTLPREEEVQAQEEVREGVPKENILHNEAEATAETSEGEMEKEPTLREIGRERIGKIGEFFKGIKESLKRRIVGTGDGISRAISRVKELGVAGAEVVMAGPEVVTRGIEAGVGAVEYGYGKGIEKIANIKKRITDAKDTLIRKGKEGIDNGIQAMIDARDAVSEYGNQILLHSAEKISKPFLRFEEERVRHTVAYMDKQVRRGKVNPGELDRTLQHLKCLENMKNLRVVKK